MENMNLSDQNNRISRLEGVLKEHTESYEAHPTVSNYNSGLVPSTLSPVLYTGGSRYKGLSSTETGKFLLDKMAFGKYAGVVSNFSDYPTGFGDTSSDLVVVSIDGFGPIVAQPSSENYFGSSTITDSGLHRHIVIYNISQGKKIEKFMGNIYNSTKNYGWVCESLWVNGTILVGSGTLKVRRWFSGDGLNLEVSADISGLNLTSSSNIVTIGTLPTGYSLDPNHPTYFTSFGQDTSAGTSFPVMTYIRGNGRELNIISDKKIDSIKFRITTSNFTY